MTLAEIIAWLRRVEGAEVEGGYWLGNVTDAALDELLTMKLAVRHWDGREYLVLSSRGRELLDLDDQAGDNHGK